MWNISNEKLNLCDLRRSRNRMMLLPLPEKLYSFLLAFFFGVSLYVVTEGCHPRSRELHVCLNIYLEKDLPFIETIVKGRKRGRVLLEGPDLDDICKHITTLYDCYSNLLGECDSYWLLDRYSRLMILFQETHAYLCSNSTDNVKDLLLNTACLSRARPHLVNCTHETGFEWLSTWKEILRMQVGPQDKCHSILRYRDCLEDRLKEVLCGIESARVYGNLMEVWLKSWCDYNSTPVSEMAYFYQPITLTRVTDIADATSEGNGRRTT